MPLNIARGHATRVHRQNLLVEARETAFMLGNDLRLEGPVPVARHFELHRPEVSLHLFPAFAVAVVTAPAPCWRVLLIAKVMAHLGIHGPLDQRFGELFEQAAWTDNFFGRLPGQ